jgi:outer membrane receptor protein involved in Fe transport
LNWRADVAWQRIVDDRVTRDFEAPTRVREENSSDLLTLSLNASGETDTLSWIAGIDLQADEIERESSAEDINTLNTIVVPSRFPDVASVDQVALFTNLDWQATSRNSISGGLRFTDVRIDVPDTTATDAATLYIRRVSGDIGWLFDVNDTWQLLANIGIGFRAPNVFDLGTLGNRPGNRFNIPNTDLEEEHVEHLDFGFRRQNERSRIELMLYALDFNNRILSMSTGDITAERRDIVQSVNAAKSQVHGAEASFEFQLSDQIGIHSIFNYTWGEQRIGKHPTEAADRIPPLSGFVSMRFDSQKSWGIKGRFSTAGKQDRLSARDHRDNRIDPAGTPGWATVSTIAEWYPNDIWQITLSAGNLLDKRYRVHGSGIDAPGRNFALTVRAVW